MHLTAALAPSAGDGQGVGPPGLRVAGPGTPVVSMVRCKTSMGIVLLVWALVGTPVAVIAALLLRRAADYLTRGTRQDRKALFKFVSLSPFLCLVWVGTVFIFQAVINESVFHRDPACATRGSVHFHKPTLIVAADNGDEYHAAQKLIVGSRLEVFNDAGHALFVDDAERFNSILDEFMSTFHP